MKGRLRSAAAIGAVVIGMISSTAYAQDATEGADNTGVSDIIVTAQKRAQNVQDVPIAISAVSNEYLESRDISSLDRLGAVSPNVKIERAPSNKTIAQISIRGSVTINPAVTWEPAVGLYLDGVYIAKAQGSIFDVADLERVEILRGPQGTLYGRNTLAGAVNLVTKKPSGEFGGSAEFSYGNFGYWKAKASVDLPQMGIFSAKFAGQIQKRDSFIKIGPNPFSQAFLAGPNSVNGTNDLDNYSGMAQLRARPSDALTIDYAFDYSHYDQRPDYAQLIKVNRNGLPGDIFDPNAPGNLAAIFPLYLYAQGDRQSQGSIDGNPLFEKSTTLGHALTISLDLGNATLKSISAYRKLRWSDSLDLDGSPLDIAFTQRFSSYHAFSQELQLSGSAMGDRLNYVVGAYYLKDKAEANNPLNFFLHGSQLDSRYGSHTEAYAAFAQVDFQIVDPLTLTVGGRYSHERKDIMRVFRVLADATIPAAFLPFTVINVPYGGVPDKTYSDFSPAVTLRYEVNDRVNVYARYARGFKSGGFNGETQVAAAPTTSCPSGFTELCEPYKPEKVDSYEVGFKSRLLDNKLQLNVAAFWDEHKDIQLSVFLGAAAASLVRNAAAARIRGLEFEAIARPADWLTINGSFALLDAKYKRFIGFDPVANADIDVSNNRAFPHAPKYSVSLGADWQIAQGDWGKFNIVGDMSFVSAYYTSPYALRSPGASDQIAMSTRSQGRTIINLRAAFSDFKIGGVKTQLAIWVHNLTKENHASNFIDFGPAFGGLEVGNFPDPRTYGLTLGVRF
jgi:iron complex outermembrane receptor protein